MRINGIILIFSIFLGGCGRTYLAISNKTLQKADIILQKNESTYKTSNERFFLKEENKRTIANYSFEKNSQGNALLYRFSLNPEKKIVYYSPLSGVSLFITLQSQNSQNLSDTIFVVRAGDIKVNKFKQKIFSIHKYYIYTIE